MLPVFNALPTGTAVATANTASTLVARDASNNFSAGTITASLTGHASLDLALTGGTMSGDIAMGTHSITGLITLGAAGAMTLSTNNGTAAVTINTSQQVGIGNTSPKTLLDINNNASSSPALAIAQSLQRWQAADTVNAGWEILSYGSTNGNLMAGFASGGTSASPTASTTGLNAFNFRGGGYNGTSLQIGAIMTMHPGSTWSGTNQEMVMDFYTTPVNTTAVQGVVRITSGGGIQIGNVSGNDPGLGGIYAVGATIKFTALANVATTSALCYNTGTGLLTYDGTVGTCTVSDERLKNMGERIPDALEKLLKINGVYYTWKTPGKGEEGRQIGVGAQTVEKVFPELVQTDSDGRKSADYQRLTAPIIEALRELKADNDNLKAEVETIRRIRQ